MLLVGLFGLYLLLVAWLVGGWPSNGCGWGAWGMGFVILCQFLNWIWPGRRVDENDEDGPEWRE